MSKSLGNFTSLTDLLARTDGRAYRLLLLRSPLPLPGGGEPRPPWPTPRRPWSASTPWSAGSVSRGRPPGHRPGATAAGADAVAVASFRSHMDDDLGTPAAVAGIFELARQANVAADAGEDDEGRRLALTAVVLCAALGLVLHGREELDEATRAKVVARDAARAAKDWARADAIRAELEAEGWQVEDGPDGGQLHR